MLRNLLSLTILVTSQMSLAEIGQKGCTNDMVVEAESILTNANAAYDAGGTSIRSVEFAEINLGQVRLCAGKVSKVDACKEMKSVGGSLVDLEKRSVQSGSSTYSELIEATKIKNEIEIFCKK